jgi:hypothetical protein
MTVNIEVALSPVKSNAGRCSRLNSSVARRSGVSNGKIGDQSQSLSKSMKLNIKIIATLYAGAAQKS